MKNYKVKAIMKFTDKEEDVRRLPYDKNLTEEENMKKGSIFYCIEERYNFLKNKNAVKLIEIVEEKEEISEEEVQAVANAIVEEAIEQDKSVKEIIKEIVVESEEKKPKKKKHSKK